MTSSRIRSDGIGVLPKGGHHGGDGKAMDSLSYDLEDSDAWRAYLSLDHYKHRGMYWNQGKHKIFMRYLLTALLAITQGCVAYFCNLVSIHFIEGKFEHVNGLLERGQTFFAFVSFVLIQGLFACIASMFVWIEPVAAGSGIPEVKCYLNGIDLPRVGAPLTLLCKVLGVTCSVAAGLPVGKEGPMVHSGAVVASTISSGQTRNDREKRDFVACGAAAGVCTAFSAPIGGILFSLEEGASYWSPSLTWRTFFCSMIAFTTLLMLNTIGSAFGKVGFNKLFSFGNFVYEGRESSFSVFELLPFVMIGIIGGLIGAVFNDTNERITHWRMKNVNHSKKRRFIEVMVVSLLVSIVSFVLPLLWAKCTPLPKVDAYTSEAEVELISELVPFLCNPEDEYNELASLIFTEPGVAIRQLFHQRRHTFSNGALAIFFLSYISLAVVTYGIAIPSGLFVPSLLSGAVFGRLWGNISLKLYPQLAFSNTYALIGAAAVLGGMARMTISLTVILLECTGNEQFVLPLMLTLMTARLCGECFNTDLYHIHIHLKKGVQFLEAELKTTARHHDVQAGQVMGKYVCFFQPVEKVGVIYDFLKTTDHSVFPVVDKENNDILFGTIDRHALIMLLKLRSFGNRSRHVDSGVLSNFIEAHGQTFVPIAGYEEVEKALSHRPTVDELRISPKDRSCVLDLRPYTNQSPISIQESTSVARTYELFRTMGLRFLPVVNKHNQIVGTITRADLTPEGLATTMLLKGKKHL